MKAPTSRATSRNKAAAEPTPPTPDFTSVVLTIDHMAAQDHAPEHVIRKFVTSTQSLIESVLAILQYYGEGHLIARESTLDLIAQAKAAENPVIVYHSPQNIQIVASGETFAMMAHGWGNGSLLQGTEVLERTVAELVASQVTLQGGVVPLTLITLSTEDPDPA